MNVVLTAERRQYTPFFKFKSSHVNLLTLLTALSDKMVEVKLPVNQAPCKGPIGVV